MSTRYRVKTTDDGQALLNLGCGTRTHWPWNNVDFSIYARLKWHPTISRLMCSIGLLSAERYDRLRSIDPDIVHWDLRRGIPFAGEVLYSTRWSASMGRARNSRSSGLGSLRDSCGGMLRSWGELHRWMYDRYSMTALLTHVGFHRVVIMNATESRIPGWAGFCLDTDRDGRVLHRDSLYVEAVRE